MDAIGFLIQQPPFDDLDDATMQRVAESMEIEFFASGAAILGAGEDRGNRIYVVRVGLVALLQEDRLLDLLTPGESFGAIGLTARRTDASVVAHEDTLCYLIGDRSAAIASRRPSPLGPWPE